MDELASAYDEPRLRALVNRSRNGVEKTRILERLPEAATIGLLDGGSESRLVLRSHEHDRRLETSSPDPLFQLETADAWQADVDDEAVGVVLIVEVCLSRFEGMDEVAVRTQQPADRTSNLLVVVDDDKGQPRRWVPHRIDAGE
jgi:hypothetical protein